MFHSRYVTLALLVLLPACRGADSAPAKTESSMPESAGAESTDAEPAGAESAEAGLEGSEGPWTYTVYYGTNRKPVSATDRSQGFGTERDESGAIHRGRCKVLINKGHEFGSLGERNLIQRWFLGDDRVLLRNIHGLASDAFGAEIQAILTRLRPGQADVVVYIHGYNNSFEEASVRAAQIGFDLKVPGVMAFFSWPSLGSSSYQCYKADARTVAASTGAIVAFLRGLVVDAGAGRVHLIVHSMGNQGLAAAISGLETETGLHFGQIILAAPDLSPSRFQAVASAYQRLAARTTLYVSSRDRALEASKWLADEPRVGYTPPIAVIAGIDTVEVTDIDLTLLGHTYYAEAEAVLYDIADLLRSGQGPAQRVRVRPGGPGAWRIGR